MNTRILNREGKLPDDGWYQIEVPGEHFNRTAGVVQLLDGAAFDAIVNRFAAEAAKPNFAGLLIDQDHFSLDPEKSTESFGWLMEVRNRAGQLEGRIEWTDIGEPAVKQKRFKFFSTVYAPQDVEKVGTRKIKNRDYPLVRPLALDRLALTNDPNNKGGKPISNRDGNSAGAADENQPDKKMKNLMKALGLAEDASEESAVAAVQVITNRATTAEGQVTTLKVERDALLTAQVEADLEKYKNRFKPADREKWKKQLIANRAGTLELLESIAAADSGSADPKHITNRQAARTPEEAEADKQAEKDRARGAKIANRASELMAANKRLSRSQAFAKATAEIGAE
jgi:hypothetical protein